MSDPHQPPSNQQQPSEESIRKVTSAHLRENNEPYEEENPIPLALLVGFFLLFTWGGFYLATYHAGWRVDVYDPNWSPGGSASASEEVVFDPIARGTRLFANNCQACHQASGQGVAGAFPPLAGSRWVTDDDGTRMAKVLLRGLQGEVVVKGNTYNGNMPSYGDNGLNWSDRDIAAVITWVRQAWDNGASAVSEEHVAEVRASIADRTGSWQGEELMAEHPLK